jgi:hypothetical protein
LRQAEIHIAPEKAERECSQTIVNHKDVTLKYEFKNKLNKFHSSVLLPKSKINPS